MIRTAVPRRLVLGSLAAAMLARPAAASGRVNLRLLETSDLHMFARNFDYYREHDDDTVGLDKVAGLIGIARKEARNSLLFDNGDTLQGNPFGDYIARPGGLTDGAVHPIFAAMNALQFDAATVGNHEFNYGLPFLERSLRGAAFPVVCSNIARANGAAFLPATTILTRPVMADDGTQHNLRIGVIGFVTPQIMLWDKTNLEGRLTAEDIVAAARREVPKLRAQCDLVVALCHSGIGGGDRTGHDENAALFLSAEPGIDAIFTGHSHRVFPGGTDYAGKDGVDNVRGTLNGVPATMPGYWGSHLGVIDLVLEQRGPSWAVADFTAGVRPIYKRDGRTVVSLAIADKTVDDVVEAGHQATRAWVAKPVGRVTGRLTSYFSLVGDDAVVNLINAAQLAYAKRLLAGTPHADLPMLSAAAPFKAGGLAPDYYIDIPAGPVALRDAAEIYLYPNTIAAVRATGAQVREWLERSAGVFRQIDPAAAEPRELIEKRVPAYNFDVIAGVTWRIDLRQPARYGANGAVANPDARRIVDLRYGGVPVDPAREFVVVTNNYRVDSGSLPGMPADAVVLRAPDTNRDAVIRYFADNAALPVDSTPGWRFEPLGGVATTFDGAPGARDLLAGRPGVSYFGAGDGGWGRFGIIL